MFDDVVVPWDRVFVDGDVEIYNSTFATNYYIHMVSQLDDAALRPLIDEMLHGADGTPADERAALFRMAWDFVGTTLAGRGFLYERFYLTSATRNRQLLHRGFDRTRANAIVDDMLAMASQPRTRER